MEPMTTAAKNKVLTTKEVAKRFNELAQAGKWFEIQDELFSDDVISDEPKGSEYFKPHQYAEGKGPVRKKGEEWVRKISELHSIATSEPVLGGNHFAVGNVFDITTQEFGRITINEIMMYEVRNGQIISERFYY
jgi:hypothetical protein